MTHRRLLFASLMMATGLVTPAMAQDNTVGLETYQENCAVCHGATGVGDGQFASLLTVKTADLTLLSSKNNGQFPFLDVFRIIDGRTTLRAHGSSAMPIWGDVFKSEIGASAGPFGSEALVRAKIVSLVDYLETLQK
jgi:mono/diheme cytochrome c family protein